MKDKVRKEALELINQLPSSQELEQIKERFERLGTLSKRDLKILQSLKNSSARKVA